MGDERDQKIGGEISSQMNFLLARLDVASNSEEIMEIQQGFKDIGWDFSGTRENYHLTPIVPNASQQVEM